jgi:hypothetical protein
MSSSVEHGSNINAGIDSSLANEPAHRGSLTTSELDSIHQTDSFKQAAQIEEEDNRELDAKIKQIQQDKVQNK